MKNITRYSILQSLLVFTLTITFFSYCSETLSQNQDATTVQEAVEVPLEYSLGSSFTFVTTSGQTVTGIVVDIDGDFIADGIDLNNDGKAEFFFTNPKSPALGIDTTGNLVANYYITNAGGSVSIWPNAEGTGAAITVFTDSSGNPTGLDTNGDGSANVSFNPNLTKDTSAPIATYSPSNISIISAGQVIIINFNESIDLASVSMSGSLSLETGGGVWSQTSNANDTLTFTPTTSWSVSSSHTLLVVGADLVGNNFTVNLPIIVDNQLPTATISPANGAILNTTQNITITFSETIGTNNVTLGGLLAGEALSSWQTTNTVFDTLVISPLTYWSAGVGKTITLDFEDEAGNTGSSIALTYTVDASVPTAAALPLTNSSIRNNQTIVVTFSREMAPLTLSLTGSMSSELSFVWSTATNTNDTLTISPLTTFSLGKNKTLIVNAKASIGYILPSLNLIYHVFTNRAYVSTTGSDADPGTQDGPKQTINAAINAIDALYATAQVRVSGGIYYVNSQAGAGNQVKLKEGISVLGGYSPTFLSWNSGVYVTTIRDTSSTTGTTSARNRAVEATAGITTATSLAYFIINGGGGDYSVGVLADAGSPTIRNNSIYGGFSAVSKTGIYLMNGSAALIDNNGTIQGGGGATFGQGILADGAGSFTISNNSMIRGGTSTNSYGINILSNTSSITVSGNTTIRGDNATSESYGIYIYGGTNTIQNNTNIKSGNASSARSIYINSGGGFIENNGLIQTGLSSGTSTGISLYYSSITVRNNPQIRGGSTSSSSSGSTGIYCNNCTSVIKNNSIYGGSSSNYSSIGIFLYGTLANPTINNNLINSGQSKVTYGIRIMFTRATIINNTFTPEPMTQNYYYGIRSSGFKGGTIRNNTFNPYTPDPTNSYSSGMNLYADSCSNPPVIIERNIIFTGGGSTAGCCGNTGIMLRGCSGRISNNIINTGNHSVTNMGIFIIGTSQIDVLNNTIINGNHATADKWGITLAGNSNGAHRIENNIIYSAQNTATTYCVYEFGSTDQPKSLRNNNFYNCRFMYDNGIDVTSMSTNITTSEGTNTLSTWNNINTNPAFLNFGASNYHLKASSPSSVRTGGRDGSSFGFGFTQDKDNVNRTGNGTTGWSMGAFEY